MDDQRGRLTPWLFLAASIAAVAIDARHAVATFGRSRSLKARRALITVYLDKQRRAGQWPVAWEWMYRDAMAHNPGAHPWDAMAHELGITREEFEAYCWAPGHDCSSDWQDMTDYQRWRDEHDPAQQLADLIMEKYRP